MISTNAADVIFDGVVVASVTSSVSNDGSFAVNIAVKDGPAYIEHQAEAFGAIQELLTNIQEVATAQNDARLKM